MAFLRFSSGSCAAQLGSKGNSRLDCGGSLRGALGTDTALKWSLRQRNYVNSKSIEIPVTVLRDRLERSRRPGYDRRNPRINI
jgi:hypothetical protein